MIKWVAAMVFAAAVITGASLRAQPVSDQASGPADPCATAGDARFKSASKTRCEGFWNVYASIPGGDVWWFDNKNGDDPKAAAIQAEIDRNAAVVLRKLSAAASPRMFRYRIGSTASKRTWHVHSKPYPSSQRPGRSSPRPRLAASTAMRSSPSTNSLVTIRARRTGGGSANLSERAAALPCLDAKPTPRPWSLPPRSSTPNTIRYKVMEMFAILLHQRRGMGDPEVRSAPRRNPARTI